MGITPSIGYALWSLQEWSTNIPGEFVIVIFGLVLIVFFSLFFARPGMAPLRRLTTGSGPVRRLPQHSGRAVTAAVCASV